LYLTKKSTNQLAIIIRLMHRIQLTKTQLVRRDSWKCGLTEQRYALYEMKKKKKKISPLS